MTLVLGIVSSLLGVLGVVVIVWGGWSMLKGFSMVREGSSSFECGFDPKDKARISFSLRFFMVIIIFMVFDMELCYILKFPYQFESGFFSGFFMLVSFMFLLLIGTLEEWRRGMLKWKSC